MVCVCVCCMGRFCEVCLLAIESTALFTTKRLEVRSFFAGMKKRPGIHCWSMHTIKDLGIHACLHITTTFERNLPLYSHILRQVGHTLPGHGEYIWAVVYGLLNRRKVLLFFLQGNL